MRTRPETLSFLAIGVREIAAGRHRFPYGYTVQAYKIAGMRHPEAWSGLWT